MRFVDLARALVLGAGVAAGACGEGLVSGNVDSSPLLNFGGAIAPIGELSRARHRPLVGVLWTDPTQVAPDLPSNSHYLPSTVDTLGDSYSAEIFRPPPAAAFVDISAGSGDVVRLALGEVVIFDDVNGDGMFSVSGSNAEIAPPDVYLAAAWSLIRYVARPFASPEPDFPLGAATATGYAVLGVACTGPSNTPIFSVVQASDLFRIDMTVLIGRNLPEVRRCAHSHSP